MSLTGVVKNRRINERLIGWWWGIVSFFFLFFGWRLGGHPSTHLPAPPPLPPPLLRPPSCLGQSPCAGLRALGMNGARALLRLWSQPGMRGLFFFFLLPSLSVVQAAGSTSSYLQQWNIPSAALIVHRRAGRHRLANQWLPLGSLGSRWGEKGLARSLPSNI